MKKFKSIFLFLILPFVFVFSSKPYTNESNNIESYNNQIILSFSEPSYDFYTVEVDENTSRNYATAQFIIYYDSTIVLNSVKYSTDSGCSDLNPGTCTWSDLDGYTVLESGTAIVWISDLLQNNTYTVYFQVNGVYQDEILTLNTYNDNAPSFWAWVSLGLVIGLVLLSIVLISAIVIVNKKANKPNY